VGRATSTADSLNSRCGRTFFWIDDVESVTDELRVNVKNIRRNVKYLDGIAMKSLREQEFCCGNRSPIAPP
jgi:hypothetical protein|tara:strand:+ start:87 stop:299 length:213 start_codon:yes stop_codon:yes gene_type:complete